MEPLKIVKRTRIELLDALRGIAILGMVFQHTLVDLVYIFLLPINLLSNPFLINLFSFGGVLFVFLSGISSQFSRHNVRRGLGILGLGILITLVTYFFLRSETIYFGILHFLGVAILIYALVRPLLQKANQMVVFVVGMALFIVAYIIYRQDIRIEHFLSFLIGFPATDFQSGDYFPVFPFLFAFLSGTGAGWYISNHKLPQRFYDLKFPVIRTVGRYSLWIYMFHQPIIIFILQLFMPIK
ncbi:MAG: heparan-alpha-glucosaminide N-acetyltransferase domain-containing protein [Clostridia bacterium]